MDKFDRSGARRVFVALAAAAALAPAAQASVIGFETRFSGVPSYTDANSLRAAVESLTAAAPTPGYCNASPSAWNVLSNQVTCGGPNGDIAFDIRAEFGVSAAQAGTWNFRIGPDFGRGGALFVDGVAVDFRSTDMWWNGSYANPSQILVATLNLGAGNHEIEAYGFEGCCDGVQQAQFLAPNARDWVVFSTSDGLDPLRVPEPASGLLLLAAGAALLSPRRRTARA